MAIFTTMLQHSTHVFFDRHPDQLMMCSLYTALQADGEVTTSRFQRITEAYIEMNRETLGAEISEAMVHRVKHCSGHNREVGNIVSLFNEVFAPHVMRFWPSINCGPQEQQSPSSEPSTSDDCATSKTGTAVETPRTASSTSRDMSTP